MVIQISVNRKDVANVRNSFGQIITNIKREKDMTPRKIGNRVIKSIREVISSKSYIKHRNQTRIRFGPYRRATGKGIGDSLINQKIGKGTYQISPLGFPEVYAIPLEEGHNQPGGGSVAGRFYFKQGVKLANSAIKNEVKKSSKRIMRK